MALDGPQPVEHEPVGKQGMLGASSKTNNTVQLASAAGEGINTYLFPRFTFTVSYSRCKGLNVVAPECIVALVGGCVGVSMPMWMMDA